MAEEDIQPLVCDNGTGMVKVMYQEWSYLQGYGVVMLFIMLVKLDLYFFYVAQNFILF